MTFLTSILAGLGIGGLVAAFVVRALLSQFLPGYLAEKGKNLAQKEDIEKLTSIVEAVKTEQALIVEQFKSTNQLRMAAIDERLAAHQKAYLWWVKLMAAVYDDQARPTVVREAWDWWNENNLYLEPSARAAFRIAVAATSDHHLLVNAAIGTADVEAVQKNWKRLFAAADAITNAVALPALTNPEKEQIAQNAALPGIVD